jgi:hypothetical protein
VIELHLFAVAPWFEPHRPGPRLLDRRNRWGWRIVAERTGQELFTGLAWWPNPIAAFIDGDQACQRVMAALETEGRPS